MQLSLTQTILAFCIIALAAILAALGFEHIGGYPPCTLCYMQRYAYYAGIPLAAIALALAWNGNRGAAAALLAIAGLGFALNAGLGVYHSGVEWKWWPGPQTCGGGITTPITGDLLEALKNAHPVSCNDAPWRFLALSFAGWNAVISAALALLALMGVRGARA